MSKSAKGEKMKADAENFVSSKREKSGEDGFSIIEAIIAITILTISLLSVVTIFAYSVRYNAGNNKRSQALAVLQQQVEVLRSVKFTPQTTDPLLLGGTRILPSPATAADDTKYQVEIRVDNDPNMPELQDETPPHNTKKIKEITLTITPQAAQNGWVTALPTTVVLRRVRGN